MSKSASLIVGNTSLQVIGIGKTVYAEITRPANTNDYGANTVINNTIATVLSFPVGRFNGGTGYINKVRIETNKANISPRLRLHIYNVAPTAIPDAGLFQYFYANRTYRIGYFDFNPMISEPAVSDASFTLMMRDRLFYACATNDTNLYAVLETIDTFTPSSGEQFYVELSVDQN